MGLRYGRCASSLDNIGTAPIREIHRSLEGFIAADARIGEKAHRRPSEALRVHRAAIRQVIESHRASNARVFGSVSRDDDSELSDLDILIDPTPETTLFDIGAIRRELRELLGVMVDVLTPMALPEHIRAAVLAEARPL